MCIICVGSLSSLKQEGSLYENEKDSMIEEGKACWEGDTETLITKPLYEKNSFIKNLEETDEVGQLDVR